LPITGCQNDKSSLGIPPIVSLTKSLTISYQASVSIREQTGSLNLDGSATTVTLGNLRQREQLIKELTSIINRFFLTFIKNFIISFNKIEN